MTLQTILEEERERIAKEGFKGTSMAQRMKFIIKYGVDWYNRCISLRSLPDENDPRYKDNFEIGY